MVVSGFGIATKCERVEQFVATGAAEIRSALDAAGGSILSVICQRRDPRLKVNLLRDRVFVASPGVR